MSAAAARTAITAPKTLSAVAKTIVKRLHAHADPARAEGCAGFFKTGKGEYGEGDKFIGVTNPQIRSLVTELKSQVESTHAAEVIQSPYNEQRFAALLFLEAAYKRQKTDAGKKDHYELFKTWIARNYVNNWNLVDCSVPNIMGDYLLDGAKRQEDRIFLMDWIKDASLWKRRAAVLTTYTFIRKKKEYTPTFAMCEALLEDREDLMHKACGWMLREVGKSVGVDVLKGFLDKNGGKMPRTMLRYAIERLPEEERKKYLQAPSSVLKKKKFGPKKTSASGEASTGTSVTTMKKKPTARGKTSAADHPTTPSAPQSKKARR